ncbi:hypothetical protein VUR80DRAFT_4155 [Thermomyces stellatus]
MFSLDIYGLWTVVRELLVYGVKVSFSHRNNRLSPLAMLQDAIFNGAHTITSTALGLFAWLNEHDFELGPP